MKYILILAIIGAGWLVFCSHLDEKRNEIYQNCIPMETIDGDYQCVIK